MILGVAQLKKVIKNIDYKINIIKIKANLIKQHDAYSLNLSNWNKYVGITINLEKKKD